MRKGQQFLTYLNINIFKLEEQNQNKNQHIPLALTEIS